MKFLFITIYLLLIICSFSLNAQNDTGNVVPATVPSVSPDTSASKPVVTPESNTSSKDTSAFSFFFTQEEETKFLEYKPILSAGLGVLSFYGEVNMKPGAHPVIGRTGFNFGVSKNINEYISVGLSAIIGKLSGMRRSYDRDLNFQTDIFTGGVNVYYNFGNFLKKEGYLIALNKQYEILPFAAIGLEAVNFNSKADLKDSKGNTYYSWSDGTIRNVPENSAFAGNSVLLQRDYKYETDLRDLNIDGQGKYSQTSFAIPLTLGFDMIIHDRVTMRLATSIHYNFSDNLDNLSSKGKDLRKGNAAGDIYTYTNVTFLFDIFSSEKILNYDQFLAENPDMSDFDKIYYSDEDKDGINDFDDKCIGTPLGVAVDKFGCPIDCDGDGIPDYLDKEYNTPKGSVVDLEGNPFTEDMMSKLASDTAKVGVDSDMIEKYYPSMKSSAKGFSSFADEIPAIYKYIDANEDAYISLEEFYNELDRFFDGRSKLRIEDIYGLMDYFFSQE